MVEPPKEVADKCVGPGPGYPPREEPLLIQQEAPREEEEAPKAVRPYERIKFVHSVRSQPRLSWPEPEPYLANLWEQHPKGHRAPVKRELVKLGAIRVTEGVAAEASRLERHE